MGRISYERAAQLQRLTAEETKIWWAEGMALTPVVVWLTR